MGRRCVNTACVTGGRDRRSPTMRRLRETSIAASRCSKRLTGRWPARQRGGGCHLLFDVEFGEHALYRCPVVGSFSSVCDEHTRK